MDTEVVETIGAAELKRLLDDGTPLPLVNRFAGGLDAWEAAGFPLEGDAVV